MNLIIYTTELSAANAHLMPWRTLLEVADAWQEAGHRVLFFSGDSRISEEMIGDRRIEHILRPKSSRALDAFSSLLQAFVKEEKGRLYFPIAAGSDYSLMAQRVESLGIEVVWYHPGAWYGKDQVLRAWRVMPFRAVLPYILQAFWPKRQWLKKLGGRPIITMTPFTAKQFTDRGYAGPVKAVYPGKTYDGVSRKGAKEQRIGNPPATGAATNEKATFCPRNTRNDTEDQSHSSLNVLGSGLGECPYFLFFGPPNPIRGVLHILDAFKQVVAKHKECRLVCLFRGDANVDSEAVKHRVEQLGFGEKVVAVWESVSTEELAAFLSNCYAVLKPFVLVPSEIPLAVIETAEHGKPVIGFEGDGTGEFVERFGRVAKHGDAGDLAKRMVLLLEDKGLYDDLCQKALKVYEDHPSWANVAADWLSVSSKAVISVQ